MCFTNKATKANKYFQSILTLVREDAEIRNMFADTDVPAKTNQHLLSFKAWKWLVDNTETLPQIIIEICQDPAFAGQLAGNLISWIRGNWSVGRENSEIRFGPWDLRGDDEYDSGNCSVCGRYSDLLINGRCPLHYL